jgi:hypothetical protein
MLGADSIPRVLHPIFNNQSRVPVTVVFGAVAAVTVAPGEARPLPGGWRADGTVVLYDPSNGAYDSFVFAFNPTPPPFLYNGIVLVLKLQDGASGLFIVASEAAPVPPTPSQLHPVFNNTTPVPVTIVFGGLAPVVVAPGTARPLPGGWRPDGAVRLYDPATSGNVDLAFASVPQPPPFAYNGIVMNLALQPGGSGLSVVATQVVTTGAAGSPTIPLQNSSSVATTWVLRGQPISMAPGTQVLIAAAYVTSCELVLVNPWTGSVVNIGPAGSSIVLTPPSSAAPVVLLNSGHMVSVTPLPR